MGKDFSAGQGTEPNAISDEQLVAVAQAGDAGAFEELVLRFGPRVFRVSLLLCQGRAEDAEDTFQNALMKAYQHVASFRGDSRFSTWLTRIAVNECRLHWRRRRREQDWFRPDEDLPPGPTDPSADPEEEYARREFQTILEHCLGALPASYRTAFVLREIDGLSQQDTAARLGLSVPALRSRVMRARLRVQGCLSKSCPNGPELSSHPRVIPQ